MLSKLTQYHAFKNRTGRDGTVPDLPWNQASTSPFDILSAADATMSSSLLCSFTITKGALRRERERGWKDCGREGDGTKGGVEERKRERVRNEDISYREKRRMEIEE